MIFLLLTYKKIHLYLDVHFKVFFMIHENNICSIVSFNTNKKIIFQITILQTFLLKFIRDSEINFLKD